MKSPFGDSVERGRPVLMILSLVVAALLTAAVVWAEPPPASSSEVDLSAYDPPDPTEAIRFAHDRHGAIECTRCHGGLGEDTGTSRPPMRVCADCHAAGPDDEAAPDPQLRNCEACHVGYDRSLDEPVRKAKEWRAVEPAPMIPPRPEDEDGFDHRRHVRALTGEIGGPKRAADVDAACRRCHGSGDPAIPGRSSCTSCHGESSDTSSSQSGSLEPANHTVDWRKRHGKIARTASGECEDCHTEDDCQSCHDSQTADAFSVHPPNFDTLHAADARANMDDCTDCHTVETFCRRCHAETKFSATEPDRPPPRFDMHPPSWTEPDVPNNHAVMARRNIEDCASCHTERDCVSCHQGVNPHPPDFRLRCKSWLKANPAPCAKCHGNLSEIRRRCL